MVNPEEKVIVTPELQERFDAVRDSNLIMHTIGYAMAKKRHEVRFTSSSTDLLNVDYETCNDFGADFYTSIIEAVRKFEGFNICARQIARVIIEPRRQCTSISMSVFVEDDIEYLLDYQWDQDDETTQGIDIIRPPHKEIFELIKNREHHKIMPFLIESKLPMSYTSNEIKELKLSKEKIAVLSSEFKRLMYEAIPSLDAVKDEPDIPWTPGPEPKKKYEIKY